MTLIVFLLILSFLVLIHEFGHMVAAKIFGVRVDEFGIGYPPKAKTLFRKWGTEFTLNWLPFGGFVRLAGEERTLATRPIEVGSGVEVDASYFYMKRKWQRIVIILAGATINFVFGAIAFSIVYSIVGIPTTVPGVVVAKIDQDSPASEAGLVEGDVVEAIRFGGEQVAVGDVNGFVEVVSSRGGEKVELVLAYESGRNVEVYIRTEEETPEGSGAMGVAISNRVEMLQYPAWQMPLRGAVVGIKAAVGFGVLILGALYGMVRDLLTAGVVPNEVAGPVGIVYQASQQGIVQEGVVAMIHFAGVLSINLAIVNILPLPALDGGRAVFVLLEKFLGAKFKPVYENWANMVGFGLLLTLIVLISLRDVGVILSDLGVNLGSIVQMVGKN